MAKFEVTLYKTVEATWTIEADSEDDAIGMAFSTSDDPTSIYDEDNWAYSDSEKLDED